MAILRMPLPARPSVRLTNQKPNDCQARLPGLHIAPFCDALARMWRDRGKRSQGRLEQTAVISQK
jgi:hypothetical protein